MIAHALNVCQRCVICDTQIVRFVSTLEATVLTVHCSQAGSARACSAVAALARHSRGRFRIHCELSQRANSTPAFLLPLLHQELLHSLQVPTAVLSGAHRVEEAQSEGAHAEVCNPVRIASSMGVNTGEKSNNEVLPPSSRACSVQPSTLL
jgi:hypothetical protein